MKIQDIMSVDPNTVTPDTPITVDVVSQADIFLEGDNARKAEETVEQISRPYGKHSE
jgi:hypothetical protein